MSTARTTAKVPHSGLNDGRQSDGALDGDRGRASKVKKRDVELPMAEADLRLAEKLDSCLRIGDARRTRFSTNKPRVATKPSVADDKQAISSDGTDRLVMGSIKRRNLTRDELRERLASRYDTLVPELDPKRTSVKLVKVLSARESVEMGKEQAKKQLIDQMELNSISGNQRAFVDGIDSFRFNDGYEMPCKHFYSKRFQVFQRSKNGSHGLANGQLKEEVKGSEESPTRTATRPQASVQKSVKFVDQVHDDETRDEVPNPLDIFAPDADYDILTDDEAEEEAAAAAARPDCTTDDQGVKRS